VLITTEDTMVSLDRLVQLKKKENETEEEFRKRFNLTAEEYQKWKSATNDGQITGRPALERLM